MKYKVGDKVRVRRDFADKSYCMEDGVHSWCVTNEMLELRGRVVTINEAFISGYRINDFPCWWTDEMFEGKTNDKKIVITTNGTETLARLYEGNKVVKSATAKCSPQDAFDFNIGAKLAFDRLIKNTAEEKEEYYNGKVVCVESDRLYFTVGKIYEFIDGTVVDDDGDVRFKTHRIKHPCEICCFLKFIPLVEEKKGE